MTGMKTIIEADFSHSKHLNDLLYVLESYKQDRMGDGTGYTEGEKARLLTQFVINPTVVVFLVYHNDKIAGGSVCFKTFSTFSTGNVLNIHDICIVNEFRGIGLGKELLKYIIQRGRDSLCSKITLEVRHDNTVAQNLYRAFGFGQTEPHMHFWSKTI